MYLEFDILEFDASIHLTLGFFADEGYRPRELERVRWSVYRPAEHLSCVALLCKGSLLVCIY